MYKPAKNVLKGIAFHLIVVILSILISLGLSKFLGILASEVGRKKLLILKRFLESYQHFIEIFFTAFFILFIEYLVYYIKIHKLGIAALNIGLFYCSTRHNEQVKKKSDDFLRKEALKNDSIAVMCANGYGTFTKKDAPLRKAFEKASHLRIMLLNPNSDAVRIRANQVGFDPDNYKKDLVKSLCFLEKLYRKRQDQNVVEVKFYKKMPFWKFIILEQSCYIWVQQYPEDKFVYDSPCYAFAKLKRENTESLYAYFLRQFNIKWNSDRLGVFDFKRKVIKYNNGKTEDLRNLFQKYC